MNDNKLAGMMDRAGYDLSVGDSGMQYPTGRCQSASADLTSVCSDECVN